MRTQILALGLTLNLMSLSAFAMGQKSPSSRPAGYEYVDPNNLVPAKALTLALDGFDARRKGLQNINYLTVIDYTQHSKNRRFYLIDMRSGAISTSVVAHGSGSDSNNDGYAEKFSNTAGSQATSLGFFRTAETYDGKNGYSLVLQGLNTTNSNAESRAIVVHGAAYVKDGLSQQGRSWGCPALPLNAYAGVIDKIRNGSLVFAYHADHF
ncbi:MAG: murein L,D-transpeptidase catalytic domain family protein [Bdellovibrionota bacterium]